MQAVVEKLSTQPPQTQRSIPSLTPATDSPGPAAKSTPSPPDISSTPMPSKRGGLTPNLGEYCWCLKDECEHPALLLRQYNLF